MRGAATLIAVGLAAACAWPALAQQPASPQAPLNTIKDVQNAIKKCWAWPSAADIGPGMEITVLLSFRRNGEMFGGRITHQAPEVSDAVKAAYYEALAAMIRRCSPLPLTDNLGGAIAGRPFIFRFIDDRKQKRA
jgi:hypothetical protein